MTLDYIRLFSQLSKVDQVLTFILISLVKMTNWYHLIFLAKQVRCGSVDLSAISRALSFVEISVVLASSRPFRFTLLSIVICDL